MIYSEMNSKKYFLNRAIEKNDERDDEDRVDTNQHEALISITYTPKKGLMDNKTIEEILKEFEKHECIDNVSLIEDVTEYEFFEHSIITSNYREWIRILLERDPLLVLDKHIKKIYDEVLMESGFQDKRGS